MEFIYNYIIQTLMFMLKAKRFKNAIRIISSSPFNGISYLDLQESTKYPEYICPLVLKNLNLSQIVFRLKNSFIKRIIIKFQEFNSTTFTTKINGVYLTLFRITVDSSLLSPFVFGKKTEEIKINGIVNEIQSDLFRSFSKLTKLYIEIENLKEILHKGLKWINYFGSFKTRNQFLYLTMDNCIQTSCNDKENPLTNVLKNPYLFLDEDFCLFEKVPNQYLLIVILPLIEKQVFFLVSS